MKFSSSLKKNHIFRRLYASKGIANSYLVLYARPNRSGHNYVGITVSKKLGHAVVRNRTRRRIREVYRCRLCVRSDSGRDKRPPIERKHWRLARMFVSNDLN